MGQGGGGGRQQLVPATWSASLYDMASPSITYVTSHSRGDNI